MTHGARATAFVTGADGFLGTEFVKPLVAHGHRVSALIPSLESAQSPRRAGAMPVVGDLHTPGLWQDEAAADGVFHLEPAQSVHSTRRLLARKRAVSMTRARGFEYPTLEQGLRQVWESQHE